MGRKVIYWAVTGLLALSALFAGVNYLWGSQQSVQTFAHLGYPQQLRVLLGIAKLLGGMTLIVPGLLTLKEWAYAGFSFAWIATAVAYYLAKDGAVAVFPLILLVLLLVSYLTRPPSQRRRLKRRHDSSTGLQKMASGLEVLNDQRTRRDLSPCSWRRPTVRA